MIMEEKRKKEMEKEMYEKAIRGYEFHIQRYNTWMNQYAIFVGAFFVAYYSIVKEAASGVIKFLIIAMGLVASFCWLGSFYGYYSWLKSWINIVHYHEGKILGMNKELRVYSMVSEEAVKKRGYSTQKITLLFIWAVIVAWLILMVYEMIICCTVKCFCCYKWLCYITLVVDDKKYKVNAPKNEIEYPQVTNNNNEQL
jgi:hypothetical protein